MSCPYKNIYDLCTNKYTYEYSKVKFISAIASSGFNQYAGSFTDVDPYSEVIRTDKDTGIREVITQYSTNNIEHCDFSTESQSITAWDCYQVYKQQGGTVSEPTLEVFRDAKYKQITDEYNNSLISGISIVINDKTIILDASMDSQIYYRNIVNTAQALYNTDIDSTMPKFIDKNNTLYSFNYDDINNIFQQYFKKVIYYKNLKDILFKKIKDSDSINNIKTISWNTSVPIESDSVTTTIVNSNDITIPTCPNTPEPDTLPPSPTEECCTYQGVIGVGGLVWSWTGSCRPECTFFTCPDSNSITPAPSYLGETTSRPCSV